MNQKKPKASSMAVLKRVISYMLHNYKYRFILVVCCIVVSAVATVIGATFPQSLVDDYITPMLASGSPGLQRTGPADCSAALRYVGGRCGGLRL